VHLLSLQGSLRVESSLHVVAREKYAIRIGK
jgi:hypothetical protein